MLHKSIFFYVNVGVDMWILEQCVGRYYMVYARYCEIIKYKICFCNLQKKCCVFIKQNKKIEKEI